MKKTIILVCGYEYDNRIGVREQYTKALIECGAIPIISDDRYKNVRDYIDIADGVLFAGGGDVRATVYGESEQYDNEVDDTRDAFEIEAVRYAYNKGKNILGICRGCQVINVALGGTLYPDVSNHRNREHTVTIKSDSVLYECFGDTCATVNTYHHQACRKIADGFDVVALSDDGIVEAIESKDKKCIGVQFHPEKNCDKSLGCRKIFERFVKVCGSL